MDMTGNETQERRIDERTAKLLQEFGLDGGYDELALRRAFVARLAELGVGGQAASSEDAPLELTDEQSALVRDYQRLRLGLVAGFSERSLEGLDSYSAIQRKYEALKPKPPEKKTVVSKVKGFGKAKKAEESTASSAGGRVVPTRISTTTTPRRRPSSRRPTIPTPTAPRRLTPARSPRRRAASSTS